MKTKIHLLDKEIAQSGYACVNASYEVEESEANRFMEELKKDYPEKIIFQGDIPHYITYDENTNIIRKATEEEKLKRGDRKLSTNEIVIEGKIISYDPYFQKIVNGQIVNKTRKDFINENIITLEREIDKARQERIKLFNALDLYDKAVLRKDITETEEEKLDRDIFRETWLDIPGSYKNLDIDIENLYPDIPEKIKYFINN